MEDKFRFAVIGGGSWGTAIVKMLCENVSILNWYVRSPETVTYIREHKHNPNYLSSVELHDNQINVSDDINEIIESADYLIFVVPSAFLHSELQKINVDLSNKIIFSAIKGIVPESSLIVGEHFHKTYNIPYENIGVVSGPCHAEEVALEKLSYLTIACQDENKASNLASHLKSEYGDNFQSVLMSNAIREMKRFIKKRHQMKRNINNSAYLGDLLVTGYSIFSRNRMFGNMIGKGYTVKSAQMEMNMVAEGYYATKSAYKLNKKETRTPIIDAVYSVLYDNKNPKKVFKKLTLTERLD